MRLLVACGAAGAISAAFSAPLAGAFYAFEVVLGAYTSAGLVPVIASAVASWLVTRQLAHPSFLMVPGFPLPVSIKMIGQTLLIGVICAFASVIEMLAVAFSERCFKKFTAFKGFLRPMLGGAMLGCLALLTPTVLGAGHGAMQLLLISNPTWAAADHNHHLQDDGVRGLAGLGLPRRPVLCLAHARQPYRPSLQPLPPADSFATWRFHLRGEPLRGPQDVGWVRQLNATSLMRTDFESALSTTTIAEAQKMFSPSERLWAVACAIPRRRLPSSHLEPAGARLSPIFAGPNRTS